MRALRAILMALLVAGAAGCGGRVEREEPLLGGIVRVGDAVLTEEMLENLLPEGEGLPISSEEKRRFVQRWIDTEVLYQEALRRGLADDPRVGARLRSLEQEFLADHLAFIELLMIAAPFRNQGIGRAVVEAVEDEIRKDAGVSTILSGVQVNNPGAVRFWQRNGYRIASEPKLRPDQTTTVDLRKDLGQRSGQRAHPA